MRKIYLIACATMMAFNACTSESEEDLKGNLDSEKLSFSTYVDMNTRALDKSSFSAGDVIGINAYQSEGTMNGNFTNNFMVNESLEKTAEGKWTYSNSKFWPVNATNRISFVASYPKIEPTIDAGKCSFAFAVEDNVDAQKDFLWSTITDAHRNDRNGTYQNGILEDPATNPITNVVLHFKHALSRVVFSAKAAAYYNGTTITVTDIIVKNLYGAGTYTLTNSLGKGDWTVSGAQDKEYVALKEGAKTVTDAYYQTYGSSLLLMPQVLNTTPGATESTVTIKYTVNYAAPAMTVNEERTFALATPQLLNGNTWEQNKAYYYNFNIALDMITFDAVIDSWGDSSDSNITVE